MRPVKKEISQLKILAGSPNNWSFFNKHNMIDRVECLTEIDHKTSNVKFTFQHNGHITHHAS